ncbi:hypothetical protein ACFV9C_44625 [Kribbella sp. NPDC059898]|uniref:hypothetical protein n=1 Tax=Kribbella sp. NPDC059898 TaxID=3346995 RepID=UPI0036570DE4
MTATVPGTPTGHWLAAADLPALRGTSGIADRLLLLLHYGIDWHDGWLSSTRHRTTYWDPILPERVISATFMTDSLRGWYTQAAGELVSAPRNHPERAELEQLLRTDDEDAAVLYKLRTETPALILRTRLTADAVRSSRRKGN